VAPGNEILQDVPHLNRNADGEEALIPTHRRAADPTTSEEVRTRASSMEGVLEIMKKRAGEPWMSGADYGRSLRGFGVNILVKDVARAVAFQQDVLAVELVYQDPDIAVLRHVDRNGEAHEWMLHADHSFADHPLLALTGDGALRGAGIELRLYDHDPDLAESRARQRGDHVLAPSADKPHGLRECCLVDPDGYVWVPAKMIDDLDS
jgi:catechol 2,3-dioxygenase-like lactoylglutathione lyase family enzyme